MQHVHAADFEGGRLFQAQHSRPSTPSSASTPRVQQLTPPITSLGDFEVFSHENELDGLRHLSLSVLEHMCACMPCFCTTQSCTPALLLLDALLPACCMEHAPAMDKPTCSKNSTNSSQLMSLSSIFRIFFICPCRSFEREALRRTSMDPHSSRSKPLATDHEPNGDATSEAPQAAAVDGS